MNRAIWLLPVPLAAIVVASFVGAPRSAPSSQPAEPVRAAPVADAPTWVATRTPPHPPEHASAPGPLVRRDPAMPKPMTPGRAALAESHPPIVATLSIDQLGTPRERLLASRGATEARQAQLDRLGDRTATHLEKLREQRRHASGEERAKLDETIRVLEKNQSLRSRVVKATVHVPARPGTEILGGR